MSSSSLNVDQRIVQMQFDNAQFEQGAATTMNTLDKLKNSLNFNGQTTGLDEVSKSIGKFNVAPMLSALDGAKSGFSALEVAAITVISNITSKVQMMGERLVKAVTIDPVKSGWSEYESKMDSIKTILNSAKDKNGAAVSLEQVKKKIEELNVYADKTIYSFADMTNNIGKFTNAGVDLDTSVAAIQGVANAAAAAGADSNAASRAMYNFAQSLSTGYMQRIDWKSIENANMATVEFKDELLKTAEAMGTVEKQTNGMYRSLTADTEKGMEEVSAAAMFTEKLSTKWLSNDVLIKTLENYSNTETDIGKKAQEAATKVFTLSKLFDTLGEAMQSGWSATWEKIVGDYNQAGELFTGINNFVSGALGAKDQKRIDFLEELLNKVHAVSKTDYEFFAKGKGEKGLAAYEKVVKKVARDHNIDIDAMIKKEGSFKDTLKNGWFDHKIFEDVNKYIDTLKVFGGKGKNPNDLTNQEILSLKNLRDSLDDTGSAYEQLGEKAGKTGRELLLESFKTLFSQVLKVYEYVKKAYDAVFPKKSASEVYNIIQRIHDFIENSQIGITTVYKIRDAFQGLFSIIKLIITPFKTIASVFWNILTRVFKLRRGVLDIVSSLGRLVDSFIKNIDQGHKFQDVLDTIFNGVDTFVDKIDKLIKGGSITEKEWTPFADSLDQKQLSIYEKVVKRIAREHGINIDEMIEKNGSFKDSLKEGWFTKDLFNEINYYLDNINNKKRKGPAIYTKEEFNNLKEIRKSLDDTSSAYFKMGDAVDKTAAEIVTNAADKVLAPIGLVIDDVIGALPKILGFIGQILIDVGKVAIKLLPYIAKAIGFIFNVVTTVVGFITKQIPKIYNIIKKIFKIGFDIVKKVLTKIQEWMPGIWDYIKKFYDKVKKLKDVIKDAFDVIKEFVENIVKLIDVEAVVGAIADFFGALASLTFGALLFVIEKLIDFFKYISSNKKVNAFFKTLGEYLVIVFKKLESGAGKVKKFITELWKLEGVQKVVEKVKGFFKDLGSKIFTGGGTGVGKLKEFFTNIGDGLPSMETVLKKIDDLLKGTTDKFQFIKDTVGGFVDLITGAFKPKTEVDLSDVKEDAKDGGKTLDSSGSLLKTSLENFVKNIEEGLGSLNSGKVLKTAGWVGLILIIYSIYSVILTLSKILMGVSKLTDFTTGEAITRFIDRLSGALVAYKNKTKNEAVYILAKAIGILTLCLIALCAVPIEKLIPVTGALFWVMIGFSVAIKALAKLFSSGNSDPSKNLKEGMANLVDGLKDAVKHGIKILSIGASILLIAAAVVLIVHAIHSIYKTLTQDDVDYGMMAVSVGLVVGIMVAMVALVKYLGNNDIEIPKGILTTLFSFGLFVQLLTGVIKRLGKLKDNQLSRGLTGFITVCLALFAGLFAIKKMSEGDGSTGDLLDIAASLLIIGVSIRILGGLIKSLAKLPIDGVLASAVAIGIITLAIGALINMTRGVDLMSAGSLAIVMLSISVSILVMSAALSILTKAIMPLLTSNVNLLTLAKYLGVLAGALLVFGIIGYAVGGGLDLIAVGLLAIGATALLFGAAVDLIVTAIGKFGPALDSCITGLISFCDKLDQNASKISSTFGKVLSGILIAILAAAPLIIAVVSEVVTGIFTAFTDSASKDGPKVGIALGVILFGALLGALGLLETYMPNIVVKVVHLVVKGLNALSKAIISGSYGLVGAIGHVVYALSAIVMEIVVQLVEWFDEYLASYFGTHIPVVDKMREQVNNAKQEMLKNITESDAQSDKDFEYTLTLTPEVEVNEDNINDGLITDPAFANQEVDGLITVNPTIETSPETDQQVDETSTGVSNKLFSSIIDKVNNGETIDPNDIINSITGDGELISLAGEQGTEIGGSLTDGMSGSFNLEDIIPAEQLEKVKGLFSEEEWEKLTQNASKGAEKGMDLSGVNKKAADEASKAEQETRKMIEQRKKEDQMRFEDAAKQAGKNVHELNYTIKAKTNDKEAKEKAQKSGEGLITASVAGVSKKEKDLSKKTEAAAVNAAKATGSDKVKNQFKTSSGHGVQGALNAFSAKMDLFYKKGVAMASNVNTGYRNTLQVKSPSRVMYKNGIFTVQGLLNAITNNSKSLYKAGAGMGEAATDGTRTALAQMSSLLAGNMDTTPTIRPVLDLTDVANGARSINGMLGGRTLSVNSLTANSLAASMNSRQNRSDMVLSALDNLSRTMSAQSTGNTYNINGITYDDGSNIATAIGMLAHAAIVEGRA